VYAKGVKRVQNAIIQALTDAVNLFLLNKGLKSYLNNFTLKMKTPVTQEEISYRENLTSKITAISSIQGLFTDIEDKPRRLRILKTLLAALNYGDALNTEIDAEIKAIEEAAAEEATNAENMEDGSDTTAPPAEAGGGEDADLGSMESLESFTPNNGDLLLEDSEIEVLKASNILTEDDLPSPADLDAEKDFSENN
jgi:hypothetical protein